MKKNTICKTISFSLLSAFILSGCTSSSSAIRPRTIAPSAIVAITANDEITWEGEETESKGLLQLGAKALIQKSDKENVKTALGYTSSLMTDAEKAVTDVLESSGFYLVPKSIITQSSAYQDAKENKLLKGAMMQTPEGYRLLSSENGLNLHLSEETGASSFIYVSMNLCKLMTDGIEKNGKLTATVSVSIEIRNVKDKVILRSTGYPKGKEKIPVVMEVYDAEKLQAMYPVLFEEAVRNAVSKLKLQ